jgi:hydroxyacylglutathione hydrolase
VIKVKTIKNRPINSNCYVLYRSISNNCLIIDPGSDDSSELITYLKQNRLIPGYIILTHEHFDHIWGVKQIKELYDVDVLCSEECNNCIQYPKKNMSVFYNQVGFHIDSADLVLRGIYNNFKLCGLDVHIYLTPGHTKGSICIQIEKILFTGDTIIKNINTVTKLPGGSKKELQQSIDFLADKFGEGHIVFPGHHDSFSSDYLKTIRI